MQRRDVSQRNGCLVIAKRVQDRAVTAMLDATVSLQARCPFHPTVDVHDQDSHPVRYPAIARPSDGACPCELCSSSPRGFYQSPREPSVALLFSLYPRQLTHLPGVVVFAQTSGGCYQNGRGVRYGSIEEEKEHTVGIRINIDARSWRVTSYIVPP